MVSKLLFSDQRTGHVHTYNNGQLEGREKFGGFFGGRAPSPPLDLLTTPCLLSDLTFRLLVYTSIFPLIL